MNKKILRMKNHKKYFILQARTESFRYVLHIQIVVGETASFWFILFHIVLFGEEL